MSDKWDRRYLELAKHVAGWSKDTTQVGAVIIGERGEIASVGYNGLPRNVADTAYRLDRPEKYRWVVHAELNAILNAARLGVSTFGKTLYTHETPCDLCAAAIVQAGLSRVVTETSWRDHVWRCEPDHRTCERSFAILLEGGVEIHQQKGGRT